MTFGRGDSVVHQQYLIDGQVHQYLIDVEGFYEGSLPLLSSSLTWVTSFCCLGVMIRGVSGRVDENWNEGDDLANSGQICAKKLPCLVTLVQLIICDLWISVYKKGKKDIIYFQWQSRLDFSQLALNHLCFLALASTGLSGVHRP